MERKEQSVRILGIDPGTAIVGYGILDSVSNGGKESLKIYNIRDHSDIEK